MNVPTLALAFAESVSVLPVVAGSGIKEAVTPLGKPDADKLTLPPKPLIGLTAIVLVAPVPCTMLRLAGDAERLKSADGTTVSETEVELVTLPEVPVIVSENVPVVADAATDSVRELLLVLLGLGANVEVTPPGNPAAEKVTLPLKPFCGVTVIVLEPLLP